MGTLGCELKFFHGFTFTIMKHNKSNSYQFTLYIFLLSNLPFTVKCLTVQLSHIMVTSRLKLLMDGGVKIICWGKEMMTRGILWFKHRLSMVSVSRCQCEKLKSTILAYSDFVLESCAQFCVLHILHWLLPRTPHNSNSMQLLTNTSIFKYYLQCNGMIWWFVILPVM